MRLVVITLFALFAFASPAFASSVTNVSVDNRTPTTAAGARTTYVVSFTLTTGISNATAVLINVKFLDGTAFDGLASETVVDTTTGQDIGFCFGPNALTIQCGLDTGASIPAGRTVHVTFNGVTNPPTTPSTTKTLSVTTTSDTDAAPSAAFNVTAAGSLSAITVNNTTPTTAAGGRTNYLVQFTLSASGALSAAANSRIDVKFPDGTAFDGLASETVVDTTTGQDIGFCFSPSGLTIECALDTNASIPAGRTVRIAFNGVTNPPTTPSTTKTLTVSTTSAPSAVTSANYAVTTAGSLSAITVDNTTPTTAAGGRTNYLVQFTLSASGALRAAAHSRIDVIFPTGTSFEGLASETVVDTTTGQDIGFCFSPSGLTIECALDTNASIPAGRTVRIAFNGVTNPPTTPSTTKTLTVSTTSDPSAVTSANYAVTAAGSLSAITVDNTTPTTAAGGRTNYLVQFTLSASGALSAAANSRIDVTFPTGTTFSGLPGETVVDTTTAQDIAFCFSPSGWSSNAHSTPTPASPPDAPSASPSTA